MEYTPAQHTEEDFSGFVALEEAFDRHYVLHEIGEQYVRVPFADKPEEATRSEFDDCLKGFFVFAKDNGEYAGYVSGFIQDQDLSYQTRRIGVLHNIIVDEKFRGQGISTKLRDVFFEWLQSEGISFCQLHVAVKNTHAIDVYKKWGFEVDELRLWKKI
jgi:ribosomal protein S18 acetylase RimI-like enzyme